MVRKRLMVEGGDSLMEAMSNMEKSLLGGNNGGLIVFSTDVNKKVLSGSKITNRLLQVYATYKNRMFVKRILNKLFRKHEIYDRIIRRKLTRTYTGKDNKTYNESAIGITCIDISKNLLFEVAEDLKDVFKQESVLVKCNNLVYFVE